MADTVSRMGKNNRLKLFALIILLVVLIVSGVVFVHGFYRTTTYYQLKSPVSQGTSITPDMLEARQVTEGSEPSNILSQAQVEKAADSGSPFLAKQDLKAHDVLTAYNTTDTSDSSTTGINKFKGLIPKGWVVTSFSVPADDAVGGIIQQGDYFDLMVATDSGSEYPFTNLLALDTTVDLNGASSSKAADTNEAHAGQTTQYVVALPPDRAAQLQNISAKYAGKIKLVLRSYQDGYNHSGDINMSKYKGTFTYNPSQNSTNATSCTSDESTVTINGRQEKVRACEPPQK